MTMLQWRRSLRDYKPENAGDERNTDYGAIKWFLTPAGVAAISRRSSAAIPPDTNANRTTDARGVAAGLSEKVLDRPRTSTLPDGNKTRAQNRNLSVAGTGIAQPNLVIRCTI